MLSIQGHEQSRCCQEHQHPVEFLKLLLLAREGAHLWFKIVYDW